MKIDVSKIDGFDSMSAEQQLEALLAFEFEDSSADLERFKNALSKANSEAAEWKRKHNALLSEEERNKQEGADRFKAMEEELTALKLEKTMSEYTAKFIAQGYTSDLAEATAKALANGDTATVFANQQKFLDDYGKKIKSEALKNTPPPAGGAGSKGMTREEIMKIKDSSARQAAIAENIELFGKGD